MIQERTNQTPQTPEAKNWESNKPIDSHTGGEQTETDYRASQDRPDHALDAPVEGSREEVEHSVVTPKTSDIDGPGAPISSVPDMDPNAPVLPVTESDDRIDHQWRAGEKDDASKDDMTH